MGPSWGSRLVTQMYFPKHSLNAEDHLIQRKGERERALMIATQHPTEPLTFKYRIVLQQA